ncbi:MAG: DUF2752 domain-containing protein [Planctomycetia bacterium]|jgi:hypothetical protein
MAATVWRREPRDHAEPPPLPVVLEARRERLLATFFTIVGFAVFLLAAIIDPFDDAGRPRTHGTHRQLGLPACTLRSLTGVGCPSCGMTTAFSLLVHGDPVAAWTANWAGCVIAVLALVGTAWFLAVAFGLPPGRFTADEVVKVTCATAAALAIVRWLTTLA